MTRLFRRRYIAFKLSPAVSISKRELLAKITENITATGSGDPEQYYIRIIDYDPNTGLGILRCDHKAANTLLSTLRNLKVSEETSAKTIRTSGSIKALKQKLPYDKYQRKARFPRGLNR